jgi:hypothetical protein
MNERATRKSPKWSATAYYDAGMGRVQEAIAAAGVTMQGPPEVEEFLAYETVRP